MSEEEQIEIVEEEVPAPPEITIEMVVEALRDQFFRLNRIDEQISRIGQVFTAIETNHNGLVDDYILTRNRVVELEQSIKAIRRRQKRGNPKFDGTDEDIEIEGKETESGLFIPTSIR